ncbi:MAG: hypothetical protein JXR77_07460 [Lentisphaeria bacterium]|nr:hypothetical protein [Lentisphaeria bacterium]
MTFLPPADVVVVRDLARRVADIAAHPVQRQRQRLWEGLNRLERVRPTVHIQALAPNIWEELIPGGTLRTTDPAARAQEMELRKRIYAWEHFRDDRVIDAVVVCAVAIRGDLQWTGFGLPTMVERSGVRSGAHAFRPVIVEERDIEKIRTKAEISVDWGDTEARHQRLCELYDGILRVEKRGRDFFWMPIMDLFIERRGIEQTFVDMLERPAWVHAALDRITTGYENNLTRLEELGLLSPGHRNTSLGSGGYAWTEELPRADFDGSHTRLRDLWARCATQIFTEGISPGMHEEFALRYERRLLERFGLSAYGCCEPLDRKMHVVRSIRNLRRVSMSPWVDVARAAEAVGRDYVYTMKPNPAIVSMERWHPELARRELEDAFRKTRHSVLEVNLQDLHTVRNEPRRLDEWSAIALDLAETYA